MQSHNKEEIHLNLDRQQILFLLHLGFIFVLPLIGSTVFNQVRQIYDYTTLGYFYCDNSMFYGFNNDGSSFEYFAQCTSTNILFLIMTFMITTSMFLFIGNKVRKFIIGAIKR